MKPKFKAMWDITTPITRWNNDRKELNKIIDVYNDWQIVDDFNKEKAKFVLSNIEYGKQTFASDNEDYLEELNEMKEFVLRVVDEQK